MSFTVMSAVVELPWVRTTWFAVVPRRRMIPALLLLFLKQTRMPQDVVPSAATTAMEESRFAVMTLDTLSPHGVYTLALRA